MHCTAAVVTVLSTTAWFVLATTVGDHGSIVPSSNIFNPNWLVQRRARHLTGPLPYSYGVSQSQSVSSRAPHYLHPYAHHQPQTAFLLQSFMAPIHSLNPHRSYYASPAVYTHYVAQAPTPLVHNTFAKRLDSSEESGQVWPNAKSPCAQPQLSSENHPVYVLPPKNFQPIIYHNPQTPSLLTPLSVVYHTGGHSRVKSPDGLWYDVEENDKVPKNEENEIELGLGEKRKKIVLVPLKESGYQQFPVYEAVIQDVKHQNEPTTHKSVTHIPEATNPYNVQRPEQTNTGRRYKTKLPVGLTSFFLGGVRGVSGRHWFMPANIVRDLEFMPNIDPMSPENKYLPEENYVKKVDNDQTVSGIAGDPEMEESTKTQTEPSQTKRIFDQNTIVDSPLDLEAQESSPVGAQTVIVTAPEQKTQIPINSEKKARSRLLA